MKPDKDLTVECYQCHGLGEIAVGYDRIQDTCAVCEGSGRISIRRIQRASEEKGWRRGAEAQMESCIYNWGRFLEMGPVVEFEEEADDEA